MCSSSADIGARRSADHGWAVTTKHTEGFNRQDAKNAKEALFNHGRHGIHGGTTKTRKFLTRNKHGWPKRASATKTRKTRKFLTTEDTEHTEEGFHHKASSESWRRVTPGEAKRNHKWKPKPEPRRGDTKTLIRRKSFLKTRSWSLVVHRPPCPPSRRRLQPCLTPSGCP